MRRIFGISLTLFLFACVAQGQNADCRQSWMPTDTPAFCPWQTEQGLPEPRTYLSAVTFKGSIYVLGGFRYDSESKQVIYFNSVLRSAIGADGKLGPWNPETSFQNGRSGAGVTLVGNCMFLAGGSSSTPSSQTYYDDTQYATIGADGKLTTWTLSQNHLRVPRSNLSLVAVTTKEGTFLNAVAGVAQIGEDTVHLDTVEVAKVNQDCSISQWVLANYHLKGGRSTPQAVRVRDSIVVIGGWGDLNLVDIYDDVQVSPARPDGSPAPWRVMTAHLPTGIYGHGTALIESKELPGELLLLSVAGQPGAGAYANWISCAYVSSGAVSDRIGIWRIAPSGELPKGRAGLAVAQLIGRIYVIGGDDGKLYHSDVLSAQFDFGHP